MSLDGQTTGDIAQQLKVHRDYVPLWIEHGTAMARRDCGKGSAMDGLLV